MSLQYEATHYREKLAAFESEYLDTFVPYSPRERQGLKSSLDITLLQTSGKK